MAPRCALFDLDGVIVDSWGVAKRALGEACMRAGLPGPRFGDFQALLGLPLGEILRRLGLPISLAEDFRATSISMTDSIHVFPGVESVLSACANRGIPVGVITGKDRSRSRHLLAAKGLDKYIGALVTPDDAPPKPDPRCLESALLALGAERQTSVYFGDTEIDMRTARAAGIPAIFASWGTEHDLDPAAYDRRMESTHDLMVFLMGSE